MFALRNDWFSLPSLNNKSAINNIPRVLRIACNHRDASNPSSEPEMSSCPTEEYDTGRGFDTRAGQLWQEILAHSLTGNLFWNLAWKCFNLSERFFACLVNMPTFQIQMHFCSQWLQPTAGLIASHMAHCVSSTCKMFARYVLSGKWSFSGYLLLTKNVMILVLTVAVTGRGPHLRHVLNTMWPHALCEHASSCWGPCRT